MAKNTLKLRFRILFFVLTCLAILIADLSIVLINKYVLSYKGEVGKHYITLIGMAAVLVIFYVFVTNITRLSEKFVNKFVHITRVYLGRQIGLYLSVSILFVFLFAGYYWAWFDMNLFNEIRDFFLSVLSGIRSLIHI
jgi:hypothetical protein